ncbi:MAG: hypothetical protein NVSMB46_09080 [Candidatus Saccharimonadales bacterium]
MDKAIFAAGCFWGVQYYFDQVPGVIHTKVGYTGGHTKNPTYEEVCSHTTGHAEAVYIEFDPEIVHYDTLVKHFFRVHDPTQLNRQGPDIGDSYRSAIYYIDDAQKESATAIKQSQQANFQKPIVTEITPSSEFYEAEDYHQNFAQRTGRGTCHVDYVSLAEK